MKALRNVLSLSGLDVATLQLMLRTVLDEDDACKGKWNLRVLPAVTTRGLRSDGGELSGSRNVDGCGGLHCCGRQEDGCRREAEHSTMHFILVACLSGAGHCLK